MLEKGKINSRQLKILAMLYTLGSAILIVPSGLTAASKQDAWIAAIVGCALGLSLLLLYNALGTRYPEQTLIQYSQVVLGRWAGTAVGILYFLFFFLLSSLVLRNIGDFITSITLPETPIQAVHIMFLLIVIIGARLGLEVVARASEIFFPWILLLLLVLVICISPQIHAYKMLPMFEEGIKPILKGSLSILGIPYLELVVFLMLYPYINKVGKAGKALFTGALFGGIVLIVITMMCILVLGADFTARHAFPSYTLAKKIHFGEFIQRIEVFMGITWFLTIYFKLIICFYASVLSLAQLCKLRSYKPLTLPMGLILIVLSLIVYPNIVYFRNFASKIWTPYALTFGLALPLLLFIVSSIRNKAKAQD